MSVSGQPIDVLLVEDDPGDELMTREAFEDNKIGNTLHVVRDGEEALDFLYRRGNYQDAPRPDLILLDLNLPKYDGRQVLERVKSDADLTDIRKDHHAVTVTAHSPFLAESAVLVAVIVAVPAATAVTSPVWETVAVSVSEDDQITPWAAPVGVIAAVN